MTTIDEMDEFVNWDSAGAAPGPAPATGQNNLTGDSGNTTFPPLDLDPTLPGMSLDPALENIDLALENVAEDDFGFSALQFFTDQNPGLAHGTATTAPAPEMQLATPDVGDASWEPASFPNLPCSNCSLGGYSCKRIHEGSHKGYCTSCVALEIDCSFGRIAPGSVNPADPSIFSLSSWPATEPTSGALSAEDLAGADPSALPSNRSSSVDLNTMTASDELAAVLAVRHEHPPPKIGARFSRESVRILKDWLMTHNRHPYPSDEEKEMLQRKTGLNKTQITNWLANARRRGKVQPPRSTSPHPSNFSTRVGSIDIPQRRPTPSLEAMNPLQRWEHSPPEHEPASVSAIARAVTASSVGSSGLNSPRSCNLTDDGSSRSICNQSSTSSLGTSQSSRDSAYSYNSRNSWGSFGSATFNSRSRRRRRRRTTAAKDGEGKTELNAPLKTFQCTFCTETFRTKHDWQRHEKSLHLSLERWVCAPHGSKAVNPETGRLSCVFCGAADPDDAHIESHNHATCQDRSPAERTFYRKDHLNQHLKLVHNVKFMEWAMKSWKIATPEIRSRCGFCGIVMDTWTVRVDHLAEHFKTGSSMADWKGDWGFDSPVLDMVENSIPPYLIHHERATPFPYVASRASPESPRNAYELIKLEMAYFDTTHREQHGRPPTDEEMTVEGCRIIFASETLSLQGIATQSSWLRDLIMKSDELQRKARFGPLRGAAENRLTSLKINGKDNLFEQCPMEFQLQEFVRSRRLLGLTAMDDELQDEACCIVGRVEEVSTHPSDTVANWLLRLVASSTDWLAPFRRRAQLPRSEDVQDHIIRSKDPTNIDSTIHSYSRLERELADFLKVQRLAGKEPSDEDLQRQARIIIYEFDDGWNQTAADNMSWLNAFRERHTADSNSPSADTENSSWARKQAQSTTVTNSTGGDGTRKSNPFFMNDANCYQRLAKELGRFVSVAMSRNNPNQHVPSDAELQYQARWLIYDDDDQWNWTAADNVEWLQRFKRNCGILDDGGPGLTLGNSWDVDQGGIGFAPPYAIPRGRAISSNMDGSPNGDAHMAMTSAGTEAGPRALATGEMAANSYIESLCSQHQRPASIFCSRELEMGLVRAAWRSVTERQCVPSAATLRAHARQILGRDPQDPTPTPADDPVLVSRFQDWARERMRCPRIEEDNEAAMRLQDEDFPSFLDYQVSDEELGLMLQEMDFDMGDGNEGTLKHGEHDGGVSLGR